MECRNFVRGKITGLNIDKLVSLESENYSDPIFMVRLMVDNRILSFEMGRLIYEVVGNAVVENRHVVVGTGSSQLILAAMYALSDPLNDPNPVSVVSASPYYSSYPEMADFLRSGLFKWAGDARTFDKDGPYIEMVTTPNNPDGFIREPVVNRAKGMPVHDLAYYWPQYTAITSAADHDIMLFTVSKCTGHAGSRIGWAIVKDEAVARKMVKFIEVSSIGVSKEAQNRAATILEIISLSCCTKSDDNKLENFFEFSHALMAERWKKLREAIKNNKLFHLAKFPKLHCNFAKDYTETYPAFAWMKCNESGVDCEKLLKGHKILTRSGKRFGSDEEYVRISMLSRDEEFDLFLLRISAIVHHDN
ncbi:PREDICTED: tryptophan aminotransferase-related protein 2-like [Erythranthe guttata]|uniref:tryptophan aminotransferase-related protein 2-like n=1 Tax=Erythranthe guttata TaxID=4155 RepID=UPI00064DE9C3|nr:PREDICTED: tryptophan aminotransferase-related protein 2-like [Erythranthe guttata]|eukprot:XP_012847991.1 PREDICTED: tryptophan aminotransferase-related protein 2-like [Erythranthe guttata]